MLACATLPLLAKFQNVRMDADVGIIPIGGTSVIGKKERGS